MNKKVAPYQMLVRVKYRQLRADGLTHDQALDAVIEMLIMLLTE